MGLKEVAEELKEQIAEAEKTESVVEDEVKNEPDKTSEDPPKPEAEEKGEEKSPEEEPRKTNADYAKERRGKLRENERLKEELAAANARAAEAYAKVEELSKPKADKEPQDPEPSKTEDPTAWLEWEARQARKEARKATEIAEKASEKLEQTERSRANEALHKAAVAELGQFDTQMAQKSPEYAEARQFYVNSVGYSIKRLNPNISNEALVRAVEHHLVQKAVGFMKEGWDNPAEALFEQVKAEGWKPQPKEQEEKKPDLDRINKNRSRNAGMAGASGSGGSGEVTPQYAATEMTTAQWAKLPTSERMRIIQQSGGR